VIRYAYERAFIFLNDEWSEVYNYHWLNRKDGEFEVRKGQLAGFTISRATNSEASRWDIQDLIDALFLCSYYEVKRK